MKTFSEKVAALRAHHEALLSRVATSTIDRLIDYCMNTPEDGLYTAASVETIKRLIAKNR